MKETFSEKVSQQIGMHSSLLSYINESTEMILSYMKNPNKQFKEITVKNIRIGRLYMIRYNYNGNFIYCPILTIDVRLVHNNYVLYAVNLEYLPYKYKVVLFDVIYKNFTDIFDKNEDIENVVDEKSMKLNFEIVYKILKSGNYDFSITAFNMSKLKNIYEISTNLTHRFIYMNTKNINSSTMKDLYDVLQEGDERKKLEKVKSTYDELSKQYNDDSIEYFKRLKALENWFKLYDL